jgi:hypothetical protein
MVTLPFYSYYYIRFVPLRVVVCSVFSVVVGVRNNAQRFSGFHHWEIVFSGLTIINVSIRYICIDKYENTFSYITIEVRHTSRGTLGRSDRSVEMRNANSDWYKKMASVITFTVNHVASHVLTHPDESYGSYGIIGACTYYSHCQQPLRESILLGHV